MVKKSPIKDAVSSANSSIFSIIHQLYITPLITSKLFAGILMILMNAIWQLYLVLF